MAGQIFKLTQSVNPARRALAQLLQPRAMALHDNLRNGSREVVGYGVNGTETYIDRLDFPMPAIRFKENTSDVLALREKEKGDWKKLSLDEKKALYRASFCQTFSEMNAPTGQWKPMLSGVMIAVSLTLWVYIWMKKFVYPPMPITLQMEYKEAQLKRMIDLRVDPVEGIGSKWDYDNNRWKE